MKKTQKAESFAWIVIWVFILSFVILGIASMLHYSTTLIEQYQEENTLSLLKQNLFSVTQKIDISQLEENEAFFIYKNTEWNPEFEIILLSECLDNLPSGWDESSCYIHQYIDRLWNRVENIENFAWGIYIHRWEVILNDDTFWDNHTLINISVEPYNN